jgi:hypothetical protein
MKRPNIPALLLAAIGVALGFGLAHRPTRTASHAPVRVSRVSARLPERADSTATRDVPNSATLPADPGPSVLAARDAGYAEITRRQQNGNDEGAVAYAVEAATPIRRDLIIAAFHEWGRRQPEAAFAAAARVTLTPDRRLAIDAVLSGWARFDPRGLAETALRFPIGYERETALADALREWMHRDPSGGGDWILAQGADVQIVAQRMFETENR